jgi:serine/threonine-protein kinase HipA
MKRAKVYVDNIIAGELREIERGKKYEFEYLEDYQGQSVSVKMPITKRLYEYNRFPPFFEGLLPEGFMLEFLLKQSKIDRDDLMSQLIKIGGNTVGNVNVKAFE